MLKTFLCSSLLLFSIHSHSQEIARFTVFAGDVDRKDCPVSVPLDQIVYNEDKGSLTLFEVSGKDELPLPCQLEPGHTGRLWFILKGRTSKGESRHFLIRQQKGKDEIPGFQLSKDQGKLYLSHKEKKVLAYQYETIHPPDGIDRLYKRSGFIHPLWSPGGEILTRIQPPDHYHHYGIWGPWAMTSIGDRKVDFWNLGAGLGTVAFSGFLSEVEGPVFSGFKALQQHLDFGSMSEDQVAISEVLDVRVWNPGGDIWLIDYTIKLNTSLDPGILLDAHRYGGGIGYRATEAWHKDNCTVLTSEKRDRSDADGSRARWCLVEGESGSVEGRSGILFMGHTSNREFPEPMRVWPEYENGGRGDLFFEFCPIRHNEWMLEKGRDYTLRYRMLVFDGALSAEEAEIHWQGFASMPSVEIQNCGQSER